MDDGDGVFVGDEDAAFPAVFDADAEVVHAGGSSEADLPVAADVVVADPVVYGIRPAAGWGGFGDVA